MTQTQQEENVDAVNKLRADVDSILAGTDFEKKFLEEGREKWSEEFRDRRRLGALTAFVDSTSFTLDEVLDLSDARTARQFSPYTLTTDAQRQAVAKLGNAKKAVRLLEQLKAYAKRTGLDDVRDWLD